MERWRMCEEFIYIMQERVDLEVYYSRNLEKISESIKNLFVGKEVLKDLFMCLYNFFTI